MLLAELHERLAPSFPQYAQKDLQTAVRVLAKALQCADPHHCPLDHYNQPLPLLYRLVETYLTDQGKSFHTIRNTKNNLSRLFRLAKDQQLFSLSPLPPAKHYNGRQRPIRPGSVRLHATYLHYAQWPTDLQRSFMEFVTWATSPVVPGRNALWKKRIKSMERYRHSFESYFGFLVYQQHMTCPTFDHLFDESLISRFVYWHINECLKRPTVSIHLFLDHLLALTRQYRPMPDLRMRLAQLKKTIPAPFPTYNKEDAWVPLARLNEIALSLWPQRKPRERKDCDHVGLYYAAQAGLSLMFCLWTYIPYRQRNMREMQLDQNLHKDSEGKWRITFRGEQLKVAHRRGKTNVFDLPFPKALVPILESYLAIWRPILLAKASQPYKNVFLSRCGTPYTTSGLYQTTKAIIYSYTGKHWHPHIVRTVWATEWIRNGGDFYKAAYMLNDKLETVIANYAHLREENVAEEVFSLLDQRNGQGK